MNDNTDFLLDDSDELEFAIKEQLKSVSSSSRVPDDEGAAKVVKTEKPTAAASQDKSSVLNDPYQISKNELDEFFDKKYKSGLNTEDEEEDEEEEEEQTDGDENAKPNVNVDTNDDDEDEDGDVLLSIIRQEGLLDIPEDFDGELTETVLEEFKNATKERWAEDVKQELRQRYAANPKALETLDYLLTGEAAANVPYFEEIQDYIEAYESYDLKDEAIQRAILTDWLQDGLDPENPAHQLRLRKVDDEVNEIINAFEGEKRAKEAKTHFLQKFNVLKQQEQARVDQAKAVRDTQDKLEKQKQMQWHQSFQTHVNKTTWNPTKKQMVLTEQYGQVMLNDGRKVPVWYAKELMIKANPELYSVYLDWLSTSFDINQGKFTNTPISVQQAANRKIIELANRKGSARRKSTEPNHENSKTQRRVVSREDLLG